MNRNRVPDTITVGKRKMNDAGLFDELSDSESSMSNNIDIEEQCNYSSNDSDETLFPEIIVERNENSMSKYRRPIEIIEIKLLNFCEKN